MRVAIEPMELMVWRKSRKLKQTQLAEMLGRSRQTIVNWETGRTPIPVTLGVELEKLAFTLAPRPVIAPPAFVNHTSAPGLYRKYRDGWVHRGIHPIILIENKALKPEDIGLPAGADPWTLKYPFEILQHPAYLEAVERWKATGRSTPGDTL